jgi:hypothetical protein
MPDDAQVSIIASMINEGIAPVNGASDAAGTIARLDPLVLHLLRVYFIESGDTARPTREAS